MDLTDATYVRYRSGYVLFSVIPLFISMSWNWKVHIHKIPEYYFPHLVSCILPVVTGQNIDPVIRRTAQQRRKFMGEG
jgi:hypothetical protein